MQKINNVKNQGFSILSVILVIVALIVVIQIWSLSGQSNTSTNSNIPADIQASAIMNDASTIKGAYDKLVVRPYNPTSIVFLPNIASTEAAPNILDPFDGAIVSPPNKSWFRSGITAPEGMWVYNPTGFVGNLLGTVSPDPALILSGVKDSICARINFNLYGSTFIPLISIPQGTMVSGATPANPITSDSTFLNIVSGVSGWQAGCLNSQNGAIDRNIYFRVLKVY